MSQTTNNNSRNPTTCPIKEGENVIFYINLSGFPLAPEALEKMWEYAKELQPDVASQVDDLRDRDDDLPDILVPECPYSVIYNKKISNYDKVAKIQQFINELQYNHTGLQFFDIRKDRPLVGLVDVAKKMIEDSLPIKCLEAVILAIYLTNEIGFHGNTYLTNNLEKFTIGFKTTSKSNIHRHVVLGIYCHVTGLFGSLGTSRRSDLGYKPLAFKTLTDLLLDFIETYSVYLHKVRRVKLGMPLPYSNRSFESIQWNGCTINMNKCSVAEWSKICEKHARVIRLNTLSTTSSNQGQQISTSSLRNLAGAYGLKTASSIGEKGPKSKLHKGQESLAKDSKMKLAEASNIFGNTESTTSIENKIGDDINANNNSDHRKSSSIDKRQLSSTSPLLNLRRNETSLYQENRSSLNFSRQSAQTSSMVSLVNSKEVNKKKASEKSLRI